MSNQVIIIGPPRSGTSLVARLLQENLGIMMDEGPIRSDTRNPQGYYEDAGLLAINESLYNRWKTGVNYQENPDREWELDFSDWVDQRNVKYERWGFKEPRMIGFIHWTFPYFENPVFIYPIRTDEQIIKSQVVKFNFAFDDARKALSAYKRLIDVHLSNKNLHRIDLSNRRSEKKLTVQLEGILNGGSQNRQ